MVRPALRATALFLAYSNFGNALIASWVAPGRTNFPLLLLVVGTYWPRICFSSRAPPEVELGLAGAEGHALEPVGEARGALVEARPRPQRGGLQGPPRRLRL